MKKMKDGVKIGPFKANVKITTDMVVPTLRDKL